MKKRYDAVKKAYPDKKIDRSFVYPISELKRVIREYRNRDLTMPADKPEVEDEIIDQTSEVIKPKLKGIASLSKQMVQLPPLPNMPSPKIAAIPPQMNPQTGLTRNESALLSPSEQVIARRT